MVTTIEHDEAQSRFTIHFEGEQAGVAEYERDGDRWVFTHTVVEPKFSGQGLAGKLVGHALDKVVADGGTIVPVCSRSEEHTSELQSRGHLVCRLLLEKKH